MLPVAPLSSLRRPLVTALALAVTVSLVGLAGTGPSEAVDEPVVLVGAGDIASCSQTGDEATADLVSGIDGTVFALGDQVYGGATLANYQNCYGPSWGAFKDRTRPVIGNHDYVGTDDTGYFDYFGASAGERGKAYYSYDLGGWHVVVLNTNCTIVDCTAGSAQEQWLRQDLAQAPTSCTVAMWHHPRFSSFGNMGAMRTQALWQALYDNGVELLLTGHDHHYERFRPLDASGAPDDDNGVREIIVGTGGRSYGGLTNVHPHSEVRNTDTFGVLKLTLDTTGYDWEFVGVPGSTFTDQGSGTCDGAADQTPPDTEITSGPSAETTSTTADFAFSATEPGSAFSCSLDAAPATSCSSPYSLEDLPAGQHQLSVAATDEAGNTDPSPATWTWQVTAAEEAGEVVVPVTADAQVVQWNGGANYGDLDSVTADERPMTHGYLRFDVPELPGPVTSARLQVYVTNPTVDGPEVASTGASWSETGLTWDNRPAAGPVLADTGAVERNAWLEYDVSAAVDAPGGHGFVLVPEVSDGIAIATKEHPGGQAARLVVGYGPDPGGPPPDTTTTTFGAVADTEAAQDSPQTSYGDSKTVSTDRWPRVESYFAFDVTGVSGSVVSAVVRLWVVNGTPDAPKLWTAESGWTESDLTWDNRPARLDPVADRGDTPYGQWVEYPVTAVVDGDGGYSFSLVPDSPDGMGVVSREGLLENRPQLVVVSR